MENINTICFGGEDWWYHNRGHVDMQLMRRFAHCGNTVYVNSLVMQKPNFRKNTGGGRSFSHKVIRKAKSIFKGLKEDHKNFWVYSPFFLPVHHVPGMKHMNSNLISYQIKSVIRKLDMGIPLVWVACPAACDIALELPKCKLVYQRTDRFEEYPNVDAEQVKVYDQKLKTQADLTIFVNQELYDDEHHQCKQPMYLDHGVDYDLFADAHLDQTVPVEMQDIPHPIVGFYGGIDHHTSDINLILDVVDRLSHLNFVFIGNASIDCTELNCKPNVWRIEKKDYQEIPHYGKCFDVAIMPWQQNDWIRACNPIKLKEYLALGKPIVSTPFTELEKYTDVVYVARSAAEFAQQIESGLQEDSNEKIEARRQKIQPYTWDSKAQSVIQQLFTEKKECLIHA